MDIKVTEAGNYTLNTEHSLSKSIVYLSGSDGGATLDLIGFGGVLTDGAGLIVPSQTEVRHGAGAKISLKVTGGSPDLVVRCVGIH